MSSHFPISARHAERQQGFTLIEILVALGLLSLIAGFAIFAYNGSKSKGQILFTTSVSIGQAASRFALDTSCIPLTIKQMFLIPDAASTDNSCGASVVGTWDGPYMKAVALAADGESMALPSIGPGASLTIQAASVNLGNGASYSVVSSNIPNNIINEAMKACNGGSNAGGAGGNAGGGNATSATSLCVSGVGAGGGNTGTFEYIFTSNN